jgi:two-component system sensor histidine kinase RpfC
MKLAEQNVGNNDLVASVRAQSKLRAVLALPIIIGLLIASLSHHGWGILLFAVHASYIVSMLYWTSRRSFYAERAALYSAVLDPLLLSAWLPMVGEIGGLIVGFYLFTILGFGFRIGLRVMQICQITAILGFAAVLIVEPFWRQHLIVWLSFLITLVAVPLYAKKLIRKLHEARAHAELESQAKSQLLAKVSHELRTPLSGIIAAGQLLAGETKDKQAAKRADTILGLSKDLLREINDLLDQAKHEAKALVLESTPFDLKDQMERLSLTLESTAAKKGIAFQVIVDPRIKDSVQGDSHYLNRVLVNLAGNAVKFTEKGKVEAAVKLLDEDESGYRLRFSVQDTGIGIPKELQDKIFEPFFQVASGTTRQYGGTGLGMTIAKEIVNLMGGDILIESEPGKGSLFYFELSLPRVRAREQAKVTSETPIVGKRILVADDNETNLTLIRELLETDQHHVICAANGSDALDKLNAHEFDVIFLDFNMGEIDGAKVLQIYRFGKLKTAPAFFLTADATQATASKLKDTGAVGVLNKPITMDGLRQAIRQVCVSPLTDETIKPLPRPAQPPALTAVPPQPINYAVIEELKSISERPQFLHELLGNAVADIERNCAQLLEALETDNFDHVRDTAHALKGVCASVGAARLVWLSTTLMRASRDELMQSKTRLVADIAEAGRTSAAALRDIMLDQAATN